MKKLSAFIASLFLVVSFATPAKSSGPQYSVYQKTLAAFGSTATTLTSQQKAQVKAAVDANPMAEKFICTGIRYFSQPTSVNIMVRKRAKAACEYAKQLNPELSTWYQNKPTQARSYAGKVLLTVKTPDSTSDGVQDEADSSPSPSPSPTPAREAEVRIVLNSNVTLIISTSVQCDPVKPGAYYACEIQARAEAPWTGGGEFKVFDDSGAKRGFLSVFSDPNPDGTRKARISLESLPESGYIKIANDQTLIAVSPPEILEVKKFSYADYKWPSSVKAYASLPVYATNLWGQPTDVLSLLVGVPTSVNLSGKSGCTTIKIPVAYLDSNGEAIVPRTNSLAKYLEIRLSTWDGNALLSKVEYGQGKIPWSTGVVTEFPIEICGVPTKIGSTRTVDFEAWASFNLIGEGSYFKRVKIVVTRVS